MPQKLTSGQQKAFLFCTLIVVLVGAVLFAWSLSTGDGRPLAVITFAMALLVFVPLLIAVSVLFRMRDELHAMHQENQQILHAIHEQMKSAKSGVRK
jgi:hypothetical protein